MAREERDLDHTFNFAEGRHLTPAELQAKERRAAESRFCAGQDIPEDVTLGVVLGALEDCSERLHRAIIATGTDEEFADVAVSSYRTILTKFKVTP